MWLRGMWKEPCMGLGVGLCDGSKYRSLEIDRTWHGQRIQCNGTGYLYFYSWMI
jgi:hypothetical protein